MEHYILSGAHETILASLLPPDSVYITHCYYALCDILFYMYLNCSQVDHEDTHNLNVQVLWSRKGSTYWVRYSTVEITGMADSPSETGFKPGDRVRVKRSVKSPK